MAHFRIDETGTRWKTIPDFPNYEVSDGGEVLFTGGIQSRPGCRAWKRPAALVNQVADKDGYQMVRLLRNGKRIRRIVHRLVAKAFIENPDFKDQINHIDGDKSNNSWTNLEWCTSKENHKHRVAVLKMNIGSGNGLSKITEMDSIYIRRSKESSYKLAMMFSVSSANIRHIRRGVTWKHTLAPEWIAIYDRTQENGRIAS